MCEFIKTHDRYGREEEYFAVDEFGVALAKELGATVAEKEPGDYGRCVLELDGLRIYMMRPSNKGGKFRLEVSTGVLWSIGEKIGHYSMPKFPRIGIDPSRPMDVLVKDIKRRLLEPSKQPLAETMEKLHAKEKNLSDMVDYVAAMAKRFPKLQVRMDQGGLSATMYAHSSSNVYMHASINSGGSISIERLGSLTQDQAAKLFEVLGLA